MTATPDRQAVTLTDEDREELAAVLGVPADLAPATLAAVERILARHAVPDQQTIARVLGAAADDVEGGYYPDGTVRVRDVLGFLRAPGVAAAITSALAGGDGDGGGEG